MTEDPQGPPNKQMFVKLHPEACEWSRGANLFVVKLREIRCHGVLEIINNETIAYCCQWEEVKFVCEKIFFPVFA